MTVDHAAAELIRCFGPDVGPWLAGVRCGPGSPPMNGVHVGGRSQHRADEIGCSRIVGKYHVTRWAPLETVERFGL